MSDAAWCDVRQHAFKRGEEGSGSFSGGTVKDGATVTARLDYCREHGPDFLALTLESMEKAQAAIGAEKGTE